MSEAKEQTPDIAMEGTFEVDAPRTLSRVRQSLAKVIGSTNTRITRPADIERAFGLDTKLAWQLYRISDALDPLEAGAHIPSPTTVKRLLNSIAKQGVDPKLIAELRTVFDSFEELVRRHAGDRAIFESLVSGLSGRGSEQIDFVRRRDAYRGNRHLYGVCAKTQFACCIDTPQANSKLTDTGMIRGFVDLMWLRPNVPFTLAVYFPYVDENDKGKADPTRAAIDPVAEKECGGPILREFSTDCETKLETVKRDHGQFLTRIKGTHVGKGTMQTIVLGETIRNIHCTPPAGTAITLSTVVRVPTETLLLDHLVHESMHGRLSPETTFWGDPSGESGALDDPWKARDVCTRLPVPNCSTYVGKGRAVIPTAEVPRHEEMVCHLCEHMDLDIEQFHVYRTRVQYPILGAVVFSDFYE